MVYGCTKLWINTNILSYLVLSHAKYWTCVKFISYYITKVLHRRLFHFMIMTDYYKNINSKYCLLKWKIIYQHEKFYTLVVHNLININRQYWYWLWSLSTVKYLLSYKSIVI